MGFVVNQALKSLHDGTFEITFNPGTNLMNLS